MSTLSFTPYALAVDPNGQPAKKKPRGRPFAKGADVRRAATRAQVGAGNVCPTCNKGTLMTRHGRSGSFVGCSDYPVCRYTESASNEPSNEPVFAAPAVASAPVGTLDALIADIARRAASESVNETRVMELIGDALDGHSDAISANVAQIVSSALANMPTTRDVTVSVNGAPAVTIAGAAHKALPRVLSLATAGFNVLLVGPAGSGKTLLGEQVAHCLARRFGTLSCSPGLPESTMIGRMVPNLTTGTENYRGTPFVDLYENGGVFLLDEVDNSDASTLLILNSALANGHLTLPDGRRVVRHADFVLIASANTYGHGQSRQYVGRQQLDAAFLDRFVGSTLSLDYDTELERALCPERALLDAVHSMRDKMRQLQTVRRIISTRGLLAARKLVLQLGDSVPDALRAITEGWTPEDRRAVGIEA